MSNHPIIVAGVLGGVVAASLLRQWRKKEERSDVVGDIVEEFALSVNQLEDIIAEMNTEMDKGLTSTSTPPPIIRMLPSYVSSLPSGKEGGQVLALDLGGSNFRVVLVELLGGGKYNLQQKTFVVPDEIMKGNADSLFGFIADRVADFAPPSSSSRPLSLGFTFSFPVLQSAINRGTLIRWTKGFSAAGCEGQDVVDLLQKQMDKRRLPIRVAALVNDTVGTLLARSLSDTNCYLGVILGTGTNAAYVENVNNIKKLPPPPQQQQQQQQQQGNNNNNKGVGSVAAAAAAAASQRGGGAAAGRGGPITASSPPRSTPPTTTNNNNNSSSSSSQKENIMIINTEWGAFNGHSLRQTRFDAAVDAHSINRSEQIFEKMISGKYLGEISRFALIEAIERGGLSLGFGGKVPPKLREEDSFTSEMMSKAEEDHSPDLWIVASLLATIGVTNSTIDERRDVQRIVAAVGGRAARLSAAGMMCLLRKMGRDRVTIAIDGSVFKHYRMFSARLHGAMYELTQNAADRNPAGKKLLYDLVNISDGSGIGAATAALMADRFAH